MFICVHVVETLQLCIKKNTSKWFLFYARNLVFQCFNCRLKECIFNVIEPLQLETLLKMTKASFPTEYISYCIK